ncbi:MAG: FAD-dependent oxidoreductase [Angustibacter sp.]
MTDPIVIIGAGLAGLAAAQTITRAEVPVLVLESSDAIGGRCRTDRVDGLLLDRGFQLLNPAYPAAREFFDVDALGLRSFGAGVILASGDRRRVLADPRREPQHLLSSTFGPGSPREKAALLRWVSRVAVASPEKLAAAPDEPLCDALARQGLTGELSTSVLRPFLRGVLGDAELGTSRRFVDGLLRSFARGRPGLPERGMSALSAHIEEKIPTGSIYLNTRAISITSGKVRTDDREFSASAIIVATDPRSAGEFGPLPPVRMLGLSTFYYLAAEAPSDRPYLHLDADHRGPVLHTAVLTAVAPSYAAQGSLIQATVLAADDGHEPEVRAQLSVIYGVNATNWSLVKRASIAQALPFIAPGQNLTPPVLLAHGIYLAGDHRGGASIEGALSSGQRAARAALASLNLPGY